MTSPFLTTRTRALARSVVFVLAMTLVTSACFTTEQVRVTQYVNNSRVARDIRPVRQNLELTTKAQAWAEHLARIGRLEHSRLAGGITVRWRSLGENVGYGANIGEIHRAYMLSPGHRSNILNGKFNYIGTGYAKKGGRAYTVQVFMQY